MSIDTLEEIFHQQAIAVVEVSGNPGAQLGCQGLLQGYEGGLTTRYYRHIIGDKSDEGSGLPHRELKWEMSD